MFFQLATGQSFCVYHVKDAQFKCYLGLHLQGMSAVTD